MPQVAPSSSVTSRWVSASRALMAALGLVLLASCGSPAPKPGNSDPNEVTNRQAHDFNRVVDKVLLRPASSVYGGVLPEPVKRGVSNFAGNLDIPGDVANNILQGRLGMAGQNLLRFGVNSTVGLLGVLDVATKIGIPGKSTDFGETLHIWGVPEGNYVEAPLLGPATDRDLVGKVVDIALNPVRLVFGTPESYVITGAEVASGLDSRARFANTIDSILYGSADSYAQTKLLYLQNRRFELGQAAGDDTFEDPYEDPYAK